MNSKDNISKLRGFEVVKNSKGKGIILPERKTKYSAGYDFYASETIIVPPLIKQIVDFVDVAEEDKGVGYKNVMKFIRDISKRKNLEDIVKKYNLRPTLVPTGVKAFMQNDEYLQIINRSSGALKRGLVLSNGLGCVDSDYFNNPSNDGEIFFQFINILPFEVTIEKGTAIGQGIFKKYLLIDGDTINNPDKADRLDGHGHTDDN